MSSKFLTQLFKAKPLAKPAEETLLELTRPWLCLDIFKGDSSAARLPEHYKKFYWQWKHSPKPAIHYIPEKRNFKLAEDGETVKEVVNEGVQVVYPDGVDNGLWAGEGVVKGYVHLGRYKGERSKYWWPRLYDTIFHSEILDKYIEIPATKRALRLIDEYAGLDYYILKTPYQELNSLLAFKLKREMLLALAKETLYPGDPEMKKTILDKYKEFVIPLEEADWLGLSLDEAITKQEKLEDVLNAPVPYKYQFRLQLLEYLNENPPADDGAKDDTSTSEGNSSMIQRLNPFKR